MLTWSIIASACRSASKRAMTCRLSMPGLMILRATVRCDRLGLLGHIDHAHAAFADLLEQLVGADLRAGALGERLVGGSVVPPAAAQELAGLVVGRQQLLDPRPQLAIAAAGRVQVARPARRATAGRAPRRRSLWRSEVPHSWKTSGSVCSTHQCPV